MQTLKQSSQTKFARGCVGLFGLGCTCFTCFSMAAAVVGALTSGDSSLILPGLLSLAFSLPFLAIGLALLGWAALPLIAGAKVSRPEVSVSSTTLRVGEPFTLTYQQSFKSGADVGRILMQLIFRERATYRRGTDTVTVTHDWLMQQFETPPRRFEAGETFNDRRTFKIPEDAMHSFAANRNSLQWFIKVTVEMSGWPDFNEEYPITVLAEKAA